ncbi:hypothetical protein YW7DRAFT_05098 [Streptomyces sp. AmelKG-E11A]|nr:hypothetical protein YW7DRAFT_05098 [Streptomyces sp. AmelKG-E11A]
MLRLEIQKEIRPGIQRRFRCLSNADGLPFLVGPTAANTHESVALKPMELGHRTGHEPHRGRRVDPQRLHADKAYDIPHLC